MLNASGNQMQTQWSFAAEAWLEVTYGISLADIVTIMKLRGVGADDMKEVRETVQHLFANIVKPTSTKRDGQQAKTHVNHHIYDFSSLTTCIRYGMRTLFWIEPKNW